MSPAPSIDALVTEDRARKTLISHCTNMLVKLADPDLSREERNALLNLLITATKSL